MERLSDEQLFSDVMAGEMTALATLVERYQQALTGYLDRLLGGDWALAQDFAQETFLRVLRQHTARGDRLFKPWLYTIATNLVRDHFKSSAIRLSTPLASEHEDWIPDTVPGPEEQALRGEQRSTLVGALNLLSMEFRATLWLRFYCDLSLQEVADTLDIPLGTVKWRLSTGLRRLRSVLATSADTYL
ncbi:MAG TPA: sigma-70 family RNA polymerase sigma factor [Ktedonobacteraceae bacterium]|jgi:RNA polymerase sigma-70 factor (ECF subfamily)|nr:sigma-70 family RNA polymerase sigma factor [Ktedonobacteraceae bacterium]